MRINFVASAVGLVLRYLALMVLAPCFVALYYHDVHSLLPFVAASIVSFISGMLLLHKNESVDVLNNIKKSEALCAVAMSWVGIAIITAIPYLFYGFSPIDSLFEAVSGVTTTGATILKSFDYPKAMFFWRSLSQWLGGMGIIVLFIAILPQFRVAGRQMFFVEATGPTEEKITPRIRHTAKAMWTVYIALTGMQIICYLIVGMPLFDSVCNSFSTLATGGFSPNPQSLLGYNNNAAVWITIIFMFLAGANFALQYKVFLKRRISDFIRNEEFRWYLGIAVGISLCAALALLAESKYSVSYSIREAVFQVVSFMTTTGFASVDFVEWGPVAQIIIFSAMFTGACAGSTAGGVKIVRIMYIFRFLKTEIGKILHPNAVLPIKIEKKIIPDEVGRQIISFVVFYFLIFALAVFAVSIIEKNIVMGLTGSITTLGNIGPGFGILGPMNTFGILHSSSKAIFIIIMLIGRLELIPFLAMLHPDFWKLKN